MNQMSLFFPTDQSATAQTLLASVLYSVSAELLSLLLLRTQKTGMSRGYDQFVGRDAYRYVRSYNALYGAAEELYVQIPEMGIREICRGILRVTEIMTETIKFNQA